ncbi:MAG: sigma 54-interacting transcriptional regulator [Bryobacteraceae bacterium]|nr:sigma 54-interacting transcriptional regulator [Bryobacteraceae bacterium]
MANIVSLQRLAPEWRDSNLLEAVFDQLADALLIYDSNRVIRGVNQAAEKLFGMSAEEMIGHECGEVFRCGVCDANCGMQQGLTHLNGAPNGTVRLHTGSGRERMALIRTSPIYNSQGTIDAILMTVKDVTEEVEPRKREVIAESASMRDVLHFVRRVAASEAATVLIEGENGTGKDLIAKTLHHQSLRQTEPFIAINCAAIPETLLESELFGYEKGAFTDARAQKRGIFELADRGTLFLDEIGEIPLMLQAKLLRVLEDQSFRRLGGLKDIKLDLRVVAATNKNLREAVQEGAFRQDLYFRLNVIHITIPPLRERPEDILPMADFFLDHYNRKFKRQIEGIEPEAQRMLLSHSWPGNVRELRNAIERAMILEESSFITPLSLPLAIGRVPASAMVAGGASIPIPVVSPRPPEVGLSLEDNEKQLILRALEKTNGNQTQAAKLLQVTRDTLRYKMKKFKLR